VRACVFCCCCCCWLLLVSQFLVSVIPGRVGVVSRSPCRTDSPAQCDATAERYFANARRRRHLVALSFSAFPERISSRRTPPTDDRRHDHVAEHGSCARWRLPDTRRRMVSHTETMIMHAPWRPLPYHLPTYLPADFYYCSGQHYRCTRRCRIIRCSPRPIAFRAASPLYFSVFRTNPSRRDMPAPRGGLVLERNSFANAERHSKFPTSARRRGYGTRLPSVGTQLEHTHTSGLDWIQHAQAAVIVPISKTGPPRLSTLLGA